MYQMLSSAACQFPHQQADSHYWEFGQPCQQVLLENVGRIWTSRYVANLDQVGHGWICTKLAEL
jgi:hypothetical protein